MPTASEILDAIVTGAIPAPPFVATLGLPQPERWEPGRVWSHWEVDPNVLQPQGTLFGGFIAALADQIAGLATLSVLNDDEAYATSDLRLSFLRAVREGKLSIEARVLHRGRTAVHVEVEFTRDDGKLAAKAAATQIVTKLASS